MKWAFRHLQAFLAMLATERKVSASTHNQAFSALLFRYREIPEIDLHWLHNINRAAKPKRITSVTHPSRG